MMLSNYYIDESGHTGDLLNSGKNFDFSGQPDFVLAAIGPVSNEKIEEALRKNTEKHRIKMHEIKSEKLKSKPNFVLDLINTIKSEGVNLLIEVVDKKFFLATSIVNCHVMPPIFSANGGREEQVVRNTFADFIFEQSSEEVFETFIEACRTDTPDAVRKSLNLFIVWARDLKIKNEPAAFHQIIDMIRQGIYDNLVESADDFEQITTDAPEKYRLFLPIPDLGKRAKSYWLLPNYSSLTHLYARINRYQKGNLSQIRLVHDEQAQFDEILSSAKAATETVNETTGFGSALADYCFSESAKLEFEVSANSPGLMVADVIAGHIRRVLKDHKSGKQIHGSAWQAFIACQAESPESGLGINFVLPTRRFERLMLDASAHSLRAPNK